MLSTISEGIERRGACACEWVDAGAGSRGCCADICCCSSPEMLSSGSWRSR